MNNESIIDIEAKFEKAKTVLNNIFKDEIVSEEFILLAHTELLEGVVLIQNHKELSKNVYIKQVFEYLANVEIILNSYMFQCPSREEIIEASENLVKAIQGIKRILNNPISLN